MCSWRAQLAPGRRLRSSLAPLPAACGFGTGRATSRVPAAPLPRRPLGPPVGPPGQQSSGASCCAGRAGGQVAVQNLLSARRPRAPKRPHHLSRFKFRDRRRWDSRVPCRSRCPSHRHAALHAALRGSARPPAQVTATPSPALPARLCGRCHPRCRLQAPDCAPNSRSRVGRVHAALGCTRGPSGPGALDPTSQVSPSTRGELAPGPAGWT